MDDSLVRIVAMFCICMGLGALMGSGWTWKERAIGLCAGLIGLLVYIGI